MGRILTLQGVTKKELVTKWIDGKTYQDQFPEIVIDFTSTPTYPYNFWSKLPEKYPDYFYKGRYNLPDSWVEYEGAKWLYCTSIEDQEVLKTLSLGFKFTDKEKIPTKIKAEFYIKGVVDDTTFINNSIVAIQNSDIESTNVENYSIFKIATNLGTDPYAGSNGISNKFTILERFKTGENEFYSIEFSDGLLTQDSVFPIYYGIVCPIHYGVDWVVSNNNTNNAIYWKSLQIWL